MSYVYALGFTTLGAALFALTRTHEKGRVPQEAIIGIVYVVASAAAILVADRVPRGGEAIKDILVGSLLWVTWPAILRMAAVYAVLGVFHFVLRRRFLTISFEPETALANGWSIRWWDFWFYLSFGVVITFSVPIAGVLLVFSFLVVPAAVAFQFTSQPEIPGHHLLAHRHRRLRGGHRGVVQVRPADRAGHRLRVRADVAPGVRRSPVHPCERSSRRAKSHTESDAGEAILSRVFSCNFALRPCNSCPEGCISWTGQAQEESNRDRITT